MADLRAAAQQALEALEALSGAENILWVQRRAEIEVEYLRAALAQEEQEQEPVARVLQTVGQYHTGRFVAEVETVRRLRDGENLYTHPPRREWQGLTEEEIEAVWQNHVLPGFVDRQKFYSPIVYAQDIEAALKERNHG